MGSGGAEAVAQTMAESSAGNIYRAGLDYKTPLHPCRFKVHLARSVGQPVGWGYEGGGRGQAQRDDKEKQGRGNSPSESCDCTTMLE